MFLQLGELDLLSFLLDLLRFFLLNRVTIVKSIVRRVSVDMIAAFGSRLAVVVNFQEAALYILSIHLNESLLGTLMSLVLNVGKAF